MSDNELLLAMSDLLEKKIKAELYPLKSEIQEIKNEQTRINLTIENEIRSNVRFLNRTA